MRHSLQIVIISGKGIVAISDESRTILNYKIWMKK